MAEPINSESRIVTINVPEDIARGMLKTLEKCHRQIDDQQITAELELFTSIIQDQIE